MSLFLTIVAGILVSVVVIVSCQKGINASNTELSVAAITPLNLSDEKQQDDFQNYLKKTVDFLNDSSFTYLFRGYNLSNLSKDEKNQIANNMLKDHNFMNRLNAYQGMLRNIEKSYRISTFTKDQWTEIIKLGMVKGIYFLPGFKEKVRNMEEKALALVQNKRGTTTTSVICCQCSDRVDQANIDLALEVAGLSRFCLGLSEAPIVAAICWAGVLAFYLVEDNRINSIEYWCDCMIENYGICVY